MPNPEHINLLYRGAPAIREWRNLNPGQSLDLSGLRWKRYIYEDIDLRNADLSEADLSDAELFSYPPGDHIVCLDFSNADLSNAVLRNAKIQNATMRDVNMDGADLADADLSGSDLHGTVLDDRQIRAAILGGIVFSGQNLAKRDLRGARLPRSDLSRTTLNETMFCEADLKYANFYGVEEPGYSPFGLYKFRKKMENNPDLSRLIEFGVSFRGPDFTNANLSEAFLGHGFFSGAKFTGANLSGADLTGADFTGANLSGAKLSRANLTGAELPRSLLKGAILGHTIFFSTNLRGAVGLEECVSVSPSNIDHYTIAISGGVPVTFLEICGLPNSFIEYLPSLLNMSIEYESCFISYSFNDETFAKMLSADLKGKGIRCWHAPEDMKIGSRIRTAIDRAIHVHDHLLLVLSESSISSQWVEQEVETALERERAENREILFPIRLDDSIFDTDIGWASFIKNTRNIGDFRGYRDPNHYHSSLNRLLRNLERS